MKKYLLEVCVDSVESAMAAERGGADRLEVCANLVIGGTTPTMTLYQEVRRHTKIPVHILVRPRCGDFCYTSYELAEMAFSIRRFRKHGADGVVFGILRPDGTLDIEHMKQLMTAASDMSVTMHRAFDVCSDPFDALEECVKLGIDTILTSGQKNTCIEGRAMLQKLYEKADGRIKIMAGAGLNKDTSAVILNETDVRLFHMSGKQEISSPMIYRNPAISMGSPFLNEYTLFRTDEELVRQVRGVLDRMQN